jgi:hypothetical protein
VKASKMKSWPSRPLQLRLVSIQVASRVGIPLWMDVRGGGGHAANERMHLASIAICSSKFLGIPTNT